MTMILTSIMITISIYGMTKRITANLPEALLEAAMQVTGKGITDTLIEGLQRLKRAQAYQNAMALRGHVQVRIDLEESRERRRR